MEDLSHSWLYQRCMQRLTNIYSRRGGNDGYKFIYFRLDFILLGFTQSFLYLILFSSKGSSYSKALKCKISSYLGQNVGFH